MGIKEINERDMHPSMIAYLNNVLGIKAKTIYQEESYKREKGMDEWIHPDIVGYKLNIKNKNPNVVSICSEFDNPKVTLYSFELKKELTMGEIRSYYFQAVSNSSWANEGYLVAGSINKSDQNLMQKIKQLNESFGIGIILLDTFEPLKSEILFNAKAKNNLDSEAMNVLAERNKGFDDYLKVVASSITIGEDALNHLMDRVYTQKELTNLLEERMKEKATKKMAKKEHAETYIQEKERHGLDEDFTYKNPEKIKFKDKEIETKTWRDVIKFSLGYIAENDEDAIKKYIYEKTKKLKGKRIRIHTTPEKMILPEKLEGTEYFYEKNNSANDVRNTIKELISMSEKIKKEDFTIVLS